MPDEAEEPKIGLGEPPPKIKAKDNPWYLLATLHGEPTTEDAELQARNRTAWNRYMGRFLDEAGRKLDNERSDTAEAATPFTDEELPDLQEAFADRHRQAASTADTALPDLKQTRIDFANVEFGSHLWFGDFVFPAQADFFGAKFSEKATFAGTTFSEWADFTGATFSERADFTGATFSKEAHFTGATFSKEADFAGATFSKWADFAGATFSEWADFEGTTFSAGAKFAGADFESAAFFVNAEMKGLTSFEAAEFRSEPPRFFGAKLHEGTVWRSISWPLPKKPGEAGRFIDAYERLKLEMDRLKKHEDELNFFALELQSKRVYHGDWKPVSELKMFGLTIPVSPLEIPKFALSSKRRTLFGRTFALPPINIPARTITLHRPTPGLPIALYGRNCSTHPLVGIMH